MLILIISLGILIYTADFIIRVFTYALIETERRAWNEKKTG